MKPFLLSNHATLLLLLSVVRLAGALPWRTPVEFPHPTNKACRATRGCDPDQVLTDHDWHAIDQALTASSLTVGNACEETSNDNQHKVQMAGSTT